MTDLTYLTFDSVREGVGASQVVPYVEGLATSGRRVTLHSFEKTGIDEQTRNRLSGAGVRWVPHRFGRRGAAGGLERVVRGASAVRRKNVLHARSDLPAASAILARHPSWVWDVRAFWADQRIALGSLRAGSPEERVLRRLEHRAAAESGAIVTLTESARRHLTERFGSGVGRKIHVIPTCVDLTRFQLQPMPPDPVLHLLFSGTMNRFYDLPTMLQFAERLSLRQPARFTVLAPETGWEQLLREHQIVRTVGEPTTIPAEIAKSSVGMSVCRFDGGPSLKAAMPTKVAEFLATGRPVVVNAGLGDLSDLLPQAGAGVVLGDAGVGSMDRAVGQLLDLLSDPGTPAACRRLAESHFDVRGAVQELQAVYADIEPS